MKMQITVQVDQELYQKICDEAYMEDRTIAAQVRRILKEHYELLGESGHEAHS